VTTPRYSVTTWLNDRVVGDFRQPIPDPFARTTVEIGLLSVLRSLLTWKPLRVTVLIDGDRPTVDAVLSLGEAS
jgi:hypothetical protein